jgi:diguanylate cyclase (GGDEF)-like protein
LTGRFKRLGADADRLTMSDQAGQALVVTEDDRAEARAEVARTQRGTLSGGIPLFLLATFVGAVLAQKIFPDTVGLPQALIGAAFASVILLPFIALISHYGKTRAIAFGSESHARERQMRSEAERREFETRLARGFEMATDEESAYDVVERAMKQLVPDEPVELLLADNSHAHLDRVAVASPDGQAPGCPVDSPDQCVAGRRAQTQVFVDSEEIDACPMLRHRDRGRCAAVCVPVSIMGRTVGVLHTTAPVDAPLSRERVDTLHTIGIQAGNRLGMLRVMSETQVQATTDGLTGLMNRRSFENRVRALRAQGVDIALVMADLDHFKVVNDAHGHEVGDRALRVFSETIRRALRNDDLACRYGGEEFAIALPSADAADAVAASERIQSALARVVERGEVPSFTASFGIAQSIDALDLDDLVQRADRAMFAAKTAGRNRMCLDGHTTPLAPTLTALG